MSPTFPDAQRLSRRNISVSLASLNSTVPGSRARPRSSVSLIGTRPHRLLFVLRRYRYLPGGARRRRPSTGPGHLASSVHTTESLADPTCHEFGQLVETYVTGELLRQAAWGERCDVFDYRDRDEREVDLILTNGARVVGIEVKASATADRRWGPTFATSGSASGRSGTVESFSTPANTTSHSATVFAPCRSPALGGTTPGKGLMAHSEVAVTHRCTLTCLPCRRRYAARSFVLLPCPVRRCFWSVSGSWCFRRRQPGPASATECSCVIARTARRIHTVGLPFPRTRTTTTTPAACSG